MIEQIDILVEEPSMAAAMRLLLPQMTQLPSEVFGYSCKPELLQRLPQRLRGYARLSSRAVVVLVDRDKDNCKQLKQRLNEMVKNAGLPTSSVIVINRIVIEELESWYFGDWAAVIAAYPKVSVTVPSKKPYRVPDDIKGGTWEAFERVLKNAGYFQTGLRSIEVAQAIASYMKPEVNTSASFQAVCKTLRNIT